MTSRNILLGAIGGSALAVVTIPVPGGQATALASQPVPTAVCTQMIYSGSSAKGYGSDLLGIKSPMTVGPTRYSELLVSAKGAKGPVAIAYGQVPSITTTTVNLRAAPNQVAVQAPMSCGLPATGLIQYGGGFTLAKKQCVTLSVSVPGGVVVARKTVPFGSVRCASKK